MADNSNDILNQLQQYGMQPPADAFNKAWERIAEEKEQKEKDAFGQLKEYVLPAPVLDFTSLKEKSKEKNITVKAGRSLSIRKIAAVLIIVAGGAIFYLTVFNNKGTGEQTYTSEQTSLRDKNQNDTNEIKPGVKDISLSQNSIDKDSAGYSTAIKDKKTHREAYKIAGKARKGEKVTFGDDNTAEVYDNDILFTLVSYKGGNSQWQPLFTDAIADKKITLNKYCWVNLSDKMATMIQDIYGIRKSGKPTRKAKRTKKKIEIWRKKDEKYFDRNMQKNPVDIIDLSDLIL